MRLVFPTGQESATFWDKGSEIPFLSGEKGTTGQTKNLAIGQSGILTACPISSRGVLWDRNERKSVEKMGFFF
jgi:hypothetical protein